MIQLKFFYPPLFSKDKKSDISTATYPSNIGDEANVHVDLCVQYMKILDEILVDQIPKLFITMLVHRQVISSIGEGIMVCYILKYMFIFNRTLDYLNGSSPDTSLMREVGIFSLTLLTIQVSSLNIISFTFNI